MDRSAVAANEFYRSVERTSKPTPLCAASVEKAFEILSQKNLCEFSFFSEM